MNTAYLSLGSNQGERLELLRKAVSMLNDVEGVEVAGISSVYETDPVGYVDQPAFLNLAVAVETTLDPRALLAACQGIESALGRTRTVRWGPRTIDIDILLYGNVRLDSEELTIPHPRLCERAFALVPLVEIAPDVEVHEEKASDVAARVSKDPSQGVLRVASTEGWMA